MKSGRGLLFLLLALPGVGLAETDDELLRDMLVGRYRLIGKALESPHSYIGRVTISVDGRALRVEREVEGRIQHARGRIEPALGGDARVLRLRYREDGRALEQTCLVSSDLDNYARITCHVYRPGEPTADPGLEALFIEHGED